MMKWLAILLAACPVVAPAAPTADAPDPLERTYRTVDGHPLKLYIFAPPARSRAPSPAILAFHGGGWTAGQADWTFSAARRFAALGFAAISVEYRLSGKGATPIDALADTCASFRWVRERAKDLGIDPLRVAGYGVSAGGHLLATSATVGCGNSDGAFANGGPDALLLWSPALDVARSSWFEKLLAGRAQAADYSPVQAMKARIAAVSIVQGERDNLTPTQDAQAFCKRARGHGGVCELHVYPGLGHLLTRDLKSQEDNYDPDPTARDAGIREHREFLQRLWP